MPRKGLEPSHLAVPEPKSGVSAISPPGRSFNYFQVRKRGLLYTLPLLQGR